MASRFFWSSFARFRATSPRARVFLALSAAGSLGLYYAPPFRNIHADYPDPQGMRRYGIRSQALKPGMGVYSVYSASYFSNFPCEDILDSAYGSFSDAASSGQKDSSFWAIYDGHVGLATAWYLGMSLIPRLISSLSDLYRAGKQPEEESIHSIIKRVFLAVDDEIVVQPVKAMLEQPAATKLFMTAAVNKLAFAYAGSCALVAFYDARVRRLHVSVVGDSRAVLGRRRETADGKTVYDVHVLSADQTARNPAEAARLTAAHPGEALFERGRTLGWGVSRAFGDGVMKWSRELQATMQARMLGDKPRATLLTPPYFTAEPETTATAIEPGDFLVMASQGLWDCLSNEEVVGLVGAWLARREHGGAKVLGSGEGMGGSFDLLGSKKLSVIERADLPVELKDDKTHYPAWNVEKRFVDFPFDAARHLARNALGGANEDLHRALMSLKPPRARSFRDDLSAIVVFFE